MNHRETSISRGIVDIVDIASFWKLQNPKSEYRNAKQYQNPNTK